jgi:AcrR family transcriptional regulator
VSEPGAVASTREKLVEGAGHVFAEHGYHATTVREIVRRSGANIAAVNYHFGGKLGLYTEVLQVISNQDFAGTVADLNLLSRIE